MLATRDFHQFRGSRRKVERVSRYFCKDILKCFSVSSLICMSSHFQTRGSDSFWVKVKLHFLASTAGMAETEHLPVIESAHLTVQATKSEDYTPEPQHLFYSANYIV